MSSVIVIYLTCETKVVNPLLLRLFDSTYVLFAHPFCSEAEVLTIIMQENALNKGKRQSRKAFITEKWCSTYVSHFA